MVLKSFRAGRIFNVTTDENRATVNFDSYPSFMMLEIWVKAHNKLGTAESEHLRENAGWFGKLNVVLLYE